LATYREWSDDPHLGDLQVKDLTLKTAGAIYRSPYWNPLRSDALPPGIDLSVFDMGANAGIRRSARLLQQALGFTGEKVDGSIGPETLAAVDRFDARILVNNLADRTLVVERAGEVGNKHRRPRSRPTMTKSAGSVRATSAASASTRAAISAAVKRTRIPPKLV
jgi:lysozyme family protein